MRINVFKPDVQNLDALRQQLVTLQDNINRALASIGYDYSQRLTFTFRPEELPKLVQHNMPRPAWGLKLVYLRNLTDDTVYPTDGLYLDWIPESGGIKIRGINGLTSGNLYEIRLLSYA